jgi:hypothetical protein
VRVAVLVVVAACRFTGTYTCAQDSQCTRPGVAGTCEPTGHCAFPDTSCASGQRYDNSAGSLASQCVGDVVDAGIDTPVDAAVMAWRINLGGPMYVGTDYPGTWAADPTGMTCLGSLPYTTTAPINGTVDYPLFQTQLYSTDGGLMCTLPGLPAGMYRVQLLLAEIYCNCPGIASCDNKFDVLLEGIHVDSIDLTNDGGGCALNTGPGQPFTRSYFVTVSDGTLNLDTQTRSHNSVLSALSVTAM